MGEINTDMKEFWEIAVSIATVLPVIGVALFSVFRNKMNTPFDNLLMDDTDKSISGVVNVISDIFLALACINIFNFVFSEMAIMISICFGGNVVYRIVIQVIQLMLWLALIFGALIYLYHLLLSQITQPKATEKTHTFIQKVKLVYMLIFVMVVFPYMTKRMVWDGVLSTASIQESPEDMIEYFQLIVESLVRLVVAFTQKWKEVIVLGIIEAILIIIVGFDFGKIGKYFYKLLNKYPSIKLIDISGAKLYYAYKVRDNQLLYGEKEVFKEQSVIRSIPVDLIYKGSKYFLINSEVKKNYILKKGDVKKLIENYETDYTLIDVSEERVFEREHINGAISIPELSEETKEDSNENKGGVIIGIDYYKNMLIKKTGRNIELDCRIIIYCKNEIRAEIATVRCMIAGYTNVFQTSGAANWEWEQEDGFYHREEMAYYIQ